MFLCLRQILLVRFSGCCSAEPKATVEDEQEELSGQDGDRYVELESFKKLLKRPKYYTKACERQLSALFAYASKLEPRKNDLPLEFINNDSETLWQYIAFRGKQISKEFRKRSGLLDVDLKLHGESDSSEDESDEDREENEIEDDHEDEEEEVEADLLNLKDEDLKDLEREMNEMREEEENQEEEEEQDENTAPRKKYPKSVLDDKFFSLAEMNAFLDEQDRMEGTGTDILDTADDSWTGTADYCYEDFFGKKDATEEAVKGKEKKLKKRTRTKESDKPLVCKSFSLFKFVFSFGRFRAKKAKTVRFAMDEEMQETDGEAEGSAQEQDEEQAPVLLGDTEEPPEETSNLKKSLKRLKETIKRLEEENLAPKSWEMSGEVTAQQRGENELLETHLQFDHGIKKAPEITEVFTEKLEDLIKQRIKDKAFDDVVRKKRIEERTEPYRNQAIEEREMVKTSLAEVYEKEYQKAAGEAKTNDGVNEEHVAIEKQVRELFRLIDALSNFDYTPPEVRPEVRVVSNMAALRVEEVGMSASTDAQLLAPEEMKKRQKGDLKADDERDRTDKLRQRRKKKNRQRAMVELFGEEKAMEGLKKKKKKKVTDDGGAAGGEKLKSTAFFSKLQETVRNEIKEKTTKKKKLSKVKSQQVSD
ncbi:Mpp10 protein, partial [Ancylostoma caninum]